MNRVSGKSRAMLYGCCLGLLLSGTPARAQTPDATIKSYIGAANGLTTKLVQMVDADSAQRTAPDLIPAIDALNPLAAQVKALYGVAANQSALQANATPMNDAQTKLMQEQSLLLTGNCSQEGTIKSLNSTTPIQVTFANHTPAPVALFCVDYNGKRSPATTVAANATWTAGGTYATHVWLAADATGKCMLIVQPAATSTGKNRQVWRERAFKENRYEKKYAGLLSVCC